MAYVMSDANNLIDRVKLYGALLGLESEMNTRLNTLNNAFKDKNYALVRSSAYFLVELAEEYTKLEPKEVKRPTPDQPQRA